MRHGSVVRSPQARPAIWRVWRSKATPIQACSLWEPTNDQRSSRSRIGRSARGRMVCPRRVVISRYFIRSHTTGPCQSPGGQAPINARTRATDAPYWRSASARLFQTCWRIRSISALRKLASACGVLPQSA